MPASLPLRPLDPCESQRERLHLEIRGAVQGVGFRPFVYRLAHDLGLSGWVRNDPRGVAIEVEGSRPRLERFRARLEEEKPAPAELHAVSTRWLQAIDSRGFEIRESAAGAGRSAVVLPDLATCPDCLRETFSPDDRRFRYPFTNCTHCGPRFSIVLALPYDRPATTMRRFTLCPTCRAEYERPESRRFHAQPNACPECGPRLALVTPDGGLVCERDDALRAASDALSQGAIVALKGIGGFQLLCDARSASAVSALRARKHRPSKALAVMVRDLDTARELCDLSEEEEALLTSAQAPIVLLDRRVEPGVELAPGVAPGNPRLGLMLPTSPLHHLLLRGVGFPLVATSGNLSDEPIAFEDVEALDRLGTIADFFLLHDRPIARHVDDSVAWVVEGTPRLLRRARGFAPMPLLSEHDLPCILATGAHQKAAVALSVGRQIFLSQHLGDLETPEALRAFERVVLDFLSLYEARPVAVAHDLHPDYPTSRWAERAADEAGGLCERAGFPAGALRRIAVQHHHAHVAACLAEPRAGETRGGPVLGFAFDGTGYGPDGTIWGGETLLLPEAAAVDTFQRLVRLRPFRLPGGEVAVREPRRVALALLDQVEDSPGLRGCRLTAIETFSRSERNLVERMIATGWNAPWTSSMGRLFDGIAALVGIGGPEGDGARVSFEAEAAMALEQVAGRAHEEGYPFALVDALEPPVFAPGQTAAPRFRELDWRPLVAALLRDRESGISAERMSARFHQALVNAAVAIAEETKKEHPDLSRVVLSGGCFQNRLLHERSAGALRAAGFAVETHRAVPPNDGGIALGQIAVAAARLAAG